MANFYGHTATRAGINLTAKLQATGRPLVYTDVQIGDGALGGRVIYDMAGLVSAKMLLPIARTPQRSGDGRYNVTAILTNAGLASGFTLREWGVFARDPDTDTRVMMLYANAGSTGDYIPPWSEGSGSSLIESVLTCACVVSGEIEVTAEIDASQVYVASEEFEAYKQYVSGQLESKVPATRTINDKELTDNIALDGSDIALTGYVRPAGPSALAPADTVNAALGKLEASQGTKATVTTYTATVSTSWSGSGPYTQNVTVEGLLAGDKPHIGPVYSAILETRTAQREAWNLIGDAEVTAANTLTLTCDDEAPSTEIPIQIEVIR